MMRVQSFHGTIRYVIALLAGIAFLGGTPQSARAGGWAFTNITTQAGFTYSHGFVGGSSTEARIYAGGVACGDYDRDGWIDLFVVRGDTGPNLLFRNMGNGTFSEVGAAAGVNQTGTRGNGPCFADMNGDGWLDLFIGGIETTDITVFRNNANGTFTNVTATTGINYTNDTYSAAFGDYDRDGDPDIFLAHFGAFQGTGHIWKNNGNGTFSDADLETEIGPVGGLIEYGFTPNWADATGDGWPDMLLVSDFGTTEYYVNDGDGTFTCVTNPAVITDEDGMGGAVADYDNDGDLDWFVSSAWGPGGGSLSKESSRIGISGNRLYRNNGSGFFSDVTTAAGVRNGYWGWGATFQDFNNDGFLDIFHTNGYVGQYTADSSRIFVSNGNGTFTERSLELGLVDTNKGRGIACFDFDRDGDLDIFTSNNGQPPTFFRNDGGNANNHLTVKLVGNPPNTEAVGARVYARIGPNVRLMREIKVGNNYLSQDPTEAHFGLLNIASLSELRVEWPSGQVDILNNVAANQYLTISESGVTSVGYDAPEGDGAPALVLESVAPNPLAHEARFHYRLARPSPVVLTIYDASGRAVRTLTRGAASAGSHEARWDGRDESQRGVAAGLYLYRLEAEGRRVQGKIAVVR